MNYAIIGISRNFSLAEEPALRRANAQLMRFDKRFPKIFAHIGPIFAVNFVRIEYRIVLSAQDETSWQFPGLKF